MLNLQHYNMKTKIERQGSTELPRFAVGALAIAGASAASGATVQITFANNYISSLTGTGSFEADLTGDRVSDVSGKFGPGSVTGVYVSLHNLANWTLARATASGGRWSKSVGVEINGAYQYYSNANGTGSMNGLTTGSFVVTFTDLRINNGAATNGWLELTASVVPNDAKVQIHRLIFDDQSTTAPAGLPADLDTIAVWTPSAIPEPSSLALLALGAGGLLARRRRAQAAA